MCQPLNHSVRVKEQTITYSYNNLSMNTQYKRRQTDNQKSNYKPKN